MFNKNNNKTTAIKTIRIAPIVLPEKNTKPIIPFVAKKNTIKPYKLINVNNVNNVNVNNVSLPTPSIPLELNNNMSNISNMSNNHTNIIMSESNLKKIPKLK